MTKLKELNNKNFEEIIKTIHSICSNIQRYKNLKKTNNSNPLDIESNYRDNIALILNSYPSPFEGLVNVEAQNNHGKTDIIINFLNNKKYVAECFVLNDNHSISVRSKNKFNQLIYNITDEDDKISLILFVLKENFEPITIFEEIKEVIKKQSIQGKLIDLQEKYKNKVWILKVKIKKYPRLDLYIHICIYYFFYDFNYSKSQK
ncbi:hypothetical protein [Vaccinium witches'-broom phytoplasma]|uniref:hypothetical protein n=1 Tax=Vaccinium witches'-broom phytoplasma TaxID=85642 RepID=UPI0003657CE1|nr:hypothetical protein [Vaccinium witches'-broom phytoplasma]